MLVYWENSEGKNQRRFFFFFEGKLYKMFLSLDTSGLADENRNFDNFKKVMETRYGEGDINASTITWPCGDFNVRAIDKLKTYDALGLSIWDPKADGEVMTARAANPDVDGAGRNLLLALNALKFDAEWFPSADPGAQAKQLSLWAKQRVAAGKPVIAAVYVADCYPNCDSAYDHIVVSDLGAGIGGRVWGLVTPW